MVLYQWFASILLLICFDPKKCGIVTVADLDPYPRMVILGPAEVVWNQSSDRCPGFNWAGHIGEQPDSMPTAWHNPLTNRTSLISATNWGTFASVGPNLNQLKHNCSRPAFVPANESTPWSYANHQWLQSTLVFPNGSGWALIHNEFHGERSGNLSYCSFDHKTKWHQCIWWSSGLGTTNDGGDTWHLARKPPDHLLFTLPRKYKKDGVSAGFGALGPLLQSPKNEIASDGNETFYGLVYRNRGINGSSTPQNKGICAFKTTDVSDPKAFRGWNGTHWSVRWVDPYTVPEVDLKYEHNNCTTVVSGSSHPNVRKFVGSLPEKWPSHVLLGWRGNDVTYSWPNWTKGEAYTQWTPPVGINIRPYLPPHTLGGYGEFMYPVLLDANSPNFTNLSAEGLSYGLIGLNNQSTYLYFVLGRKMIARLRVAFVPGNAPPSPAPPPTLPPNPKNCTKILVDGAGNATVNGVYKLVIANYSSGRSLYELENDKNRQLYYSNGSRHWHLGHVGHPPVAYQSLLRPKDGSVPPIEWTSTFLNGSGVAPWPTVVCKL